MDISDKIKRRRDETLATMWFTLNSWGWPKELGEPQNISSTVRSGYMHDIAAELGERRIRKVLWQCHPDRKG